MADKSMQFLYGDRELIMVSGDLLDVEVDVIVSPADCDLSHSHPMAMKISSAGGSIVTEQSSQLIKEYKSIESGMAVYTTAGQLPFDALVHAVSPVMGEGNEQHKIEQAISRSLLLCETNDWTSIAFPALGTAHFEIPITTCAQAYFRSITSFWDARFECSVDKIVLCLDEDELQPFFEAFRDDAIMTDEVVNEEQCEERAESVGYVEISEEDLEAMEDPEIEDWFK